MNWFIRFLTSSIGQKLVMSLTGLFLISFLAVHLLGNLQLLYSDGGEAFNIYAHFMTTNPLIKFLSYGLYSFILLHAIQGIFLWQTNKAAKGSKYAVGNAKASWASRNMGSLGMIILIFLIIHLAQFWFKMKMGWTEMITYEGHDEPVKNLFEIVDGVYQNPLYVLFYVVCMIGIGFHLSHGFQSSFQSLGLNHKKYTPFIKAVGLGYSILIPLLFAIIPIWMYLKHAFNL